MKTFQVVAVMLAAFLIVGCGSDTGQISTPDSGSNQSAVAPSLMKGPKLALEPGGYYSFCWGTPPDDFAYRDFSLISTRTGLATHKWYIDLTAAEGVTPIGLAFDVDGTIYTTLNHLDFDPANSWSQLARVDPVTGAVTRIGGRFPMHTSGPEIDACGNLYVLGFDVPPLGYVHGDRYLYRMDKLTGVATQIGYTGDDHEWMDMAFDSQGRLWGTWGNKLYVIDTQTGAATLVTPIFGVPGDPPPAPYTLRQEVMSIAFDEHDVLYGTAMNVEWDTGHGSPVVKINTTTGQATLIGYTERQYNHGGDIMPTKVRVCHRTGNGNYVSIVVSMDALAAHLTHGDIVPGAAGNSCNCP